MTTPTDKLLADCYDNARFIPNPSRPRNLGTLANSIAQEGYVAAPGDRPITLLIEIEDGVITYVVRDGNHRMTAAAMAGMDMVEADIHVVRFSSGELISESVHPGHLVRLWAA